MSSKILTILISLFCLFLSSNSDTRPINGDCNSPRSGTCMNIWDCPYYANLLKRTSIPRPYVIIQNLRKNLCGFVDRNTPEICCNDPLITNNKISYNNNEKDNVLNHENFERLPNDICGRVAVDTRITGGIRTNPSDFPWMALIAYRKDDNLAEFRCGGSLINNRYVLTAAHCIEDSSLLGVRLGEYNILKDIDCDSTGQKCKPPVQDFLINKSIIHPLYDPDTLINDIALLKISSTVNFIEGHIEPICLPTGNLMDFNLDRRNVVVTGWGATAYGDKSAILLKVVMPTIPIRDCQRLYANLKPISDSQICAGGSHGKDSCAGDSGGPLQFINKINGTTRFVQYGIVSYGPRYCGMDGRPGIYTKITDYMKWILDNLETD